MRRFASFVNCFLQNWSIDTFKHKTDKSSNQNKLFYVHFQEMPGFKGKRKRGLTLTLYNKPFRYRLPVLPPRKRTKTSSSTPNLKSPSIRTPSLLKKSLSISKYLYPFKRVSTSIQRNFLLKMKETSPQIYRSYNITWFQHIHRSNVNKHSLSSHE